MHAILALTLVLALGQPAAEAAPPPDIILHHGKIVTVDDQFRLAEALAVRGDRIVAVGGNEALCGLAGPRTRQIDLGRQDGPAGADRFAFAPYVVGHV